MDGALNFDGKKYISAKVAAKNFGYTSDYVGQLCRARKVDCRQVGRSWYVLESDMVEHKNNNLHSGQNISPVIVKNNKKYSQIKNPDPVLGGLEDGLEKESEGLGVDRATSSFVHKAKSRLSEMPPKNILYSKDDRELFPSVVKKVDFESLKYAALNGLERSLKKPKKVSDFERFFAKSVATVFVVTALGCLAFERDSFINLARVSVVGGAKAELSTLYGPNFVGLQRGYLDLKKSLGSEGLNETRLAASIFSGNAAWDWAKDLAYKAIRPWLENDPGMFEGTLIVEDKSITPQPPLTLRGGEGTGSTVVQAKTVFIPSNDRAYVDLKVEEKFNELKNWFATNPTAPNVNRVYITRQNDSLVDSLSHGVTMEEVNAAVSAHASAGVNFGQSWEIDSLGFLAPTTTVTTLLNGGFLSTASSTIVGNATTTGSMGLGALFLNNDYITDLTGSGLTVTAGVLSVNASSIPNYDWTFANNYGAVNLTPTSTVAFWAQGGINASSTSRFVYASSTSLSSEGSSYFATGGGRVGIGTTLPSTLLHLSSNTSGNALAYFDNYNASPDNGIIFRSARGSASSPGAIQSNDNMFNILGRAHTGSAFTSGSKVAISAFASQNWSGSANGTYMTFRITPNDSTTLTEAIRINSDSNIGISSTTPWGLLSVNANGLAAGTPQFVVGSSTATNFIVANGGNVGVGTAGPNSKLHVAGGAIQAGTSVSAITYATRENGIIFNRADLPSTWLNKISNSISGTAADTTMNFELATGASSNTTVMTLNAAGNVGIGTNNPTQGQLVVNKNIVANQQNANLATIGSVVGNESYPGIWFGSATPSLSNFALLGDIGPNQTILNAPSGGSLDFRVGNSGFMRINSVGLTGIGSTTPWGLLSVNANALTAGTPQFVVGSSTATNFIVANNGNVGVGTLAPTAPLHVNKALAGSYAAIFENSDGTSSGVYIRGGASDGTTNSLEVRNRANTNLMSVLGNGNVGIGTTAPGNKLNVVVSDANTSLAASVTQEGLRLSNSNSTTNNWNEIAFYNSTNASIAGVLGFQNTDTTNNYGDFAFATRGSGGFGERMRITSTGNVGIGTTTPTSILDIRHANVGVNNGLGVTAPFIGTNDTQAIDRGGMLQLGGAQSTSFPKVVFGSISGRKENSTSGDNAGYLQFATNNSGGSVLERMRIDSNGNVGIGSTSPSYVVSVGNSSHKQLQLYRSGTYSVGAGFWLDFAMDNSSSVPTTFARINPITAALTAGAEGGILAFDTMKAGVMTEQMRIDNQGNIGIGTTTPWGLLSVNANGLAAGVPQFVVGSSTKTNLAVANDGTVLIGTPSVVNGGDKSLQVYRSNPGTGLEARMESTTGSFNAAINGTAVGSGPTNNVALYGWASGATNNYGLYIESGHGYFAENVGIGTTSPSAKLSVTGGGTGTGRAFAISNSSDAEKFTVLDNGNVGIGTTGPGAKLHVSGGSSTNVARFQVGTSNYLRVDSDGIGALLSNDTANTLYLNYFGGDVNIAGDKLYVTRSTGNVGIGTTSPATILQVGSGSSSAIPVLSVNGGTNSGTGPYLRFDRGGTPKGYIGTDSAVIGGTSDDLSLSAVSSGIRFYNSTTELVRILSTGNVGVGTTTPLNKFDVEQSTNAAVVGRLTNPSVGGTAQAILSVANDYSTGILSLGSTGTGYSPAGVFVADGGYINAHAGLAGGLSLLTSASAPIRFATNGFANERMRIDESGNVGIGTTSPVEKLSILDADNVDDTALGIRSNNLTVGMGLTFSGLKAIGTNSIIDVSVTAKGAGNVWLGQDTAATGYRISPTDGANNNIWFGNRTVGLTADSGNKIHIAKTSALSTGLTVETTGGFVGIGTTTPFGKLSINPVAGDSVAFDVGSSTKSIFRILTTSTTTAAFGMDIATGCYAIGGVCISGGGGGSGTVDSGLTGQLPFYNADGTTLTATSSIFLLPNGNLGVSTTTPWAKLGIGMSSSTPSLVVGAAGSSSPAFYVSSANGNGNVGIGTGAPTHRLTVSNNSAAQAIFTGWSPIAGNSAGSGNILLGNQSAFQGSIHYDGTGGDLYIDNTYSNPIGDIIFRTRTAGSAVRAMTIIGTGQVGIGTTSPLANLSVSNYSTGANTAPLFVVASSTGTLATSTEFIINSVGNVGIGTSTPNAALALQGAVGIDIFSIASSTGTPIITISEWGGFVQRVSSTTAFSVQMASGTPVFSVDTTASNTNAGLDITAATGQTSNLLNFYSSGGGFLSGFTASGGLFMNIASTTAINLYDGSSNAAFVVNSTGKSVGIGTSTLSYALTVEGSQASTYVARINNAATDTTADGLLISLGVANASRTTGNYFIGFADGSQTVAGKIQGGASAVAYTTSAADLAEYFRASDINDLPKSGEVVVLDTTKNKTVKIAGTDEPASSEPLGVISTNPGFIGNAPICLASDADCDKNYAKYNVMVAIAGQVPVRVSLENGPIKVGDYLTLSSTTPGAATKLVGSGYVIGQAIESATTTVFKNPDFDNATSTGSTELAQTVNIFIKSGWRDAPSTGSGQVASSTEFSIPSRFASLFSFFKTIGLEVGQNFVKITNLITQKITADKVETKELCIEGVCVNKDQLSALIAASGVVSISGDGTPPPGDPATTTPPIVVEPDPTASSTPVVAEPEVVEVPEVVPEVAEEAEAVEVPEAEEIVEESSI